MCVVRAVMVLRFLVLGDKFMIQPQVPEYSIQFQLSLFRTVGGKPMCDVIMDDDVSFSFWC